MAEEKRLPGITPERIQVHVVVVNPDGNDGKGQTIVDEVASIEHLSKRGNMMDIFLSTGKSLCWDGERWDCWNDHGRRQGFPFEAQVFKA